MFGGAIRRLVAWQHSVSIGTYTDVDRFNDHDNEAPRAQTHHRNYARNTTPRKECRFAVNALQICLRPQYTTLPTRLPTAVRVCTARCCAMQPACGATQHLSTHPPPPSSALSCPTLPNQALTPSALPCPLQSSTTHPPILGAFRAPIPSQQSPARTSPQRSRMHIPRTRVPIFSAAARAKNRTP